MKKHISVLKGDDDKWHIKRESSGRFVGTYSTQKDAIAAAKSSAKGSKTIIVHAANGAVRQVLTTGVSRTASTGRFVASSKDSKKIDVAIVSVMKKKNA